MRIKSGTALWAVSAVLLAACQPALKQADMIFSNGAVYTANAAHDVQEIVVIADGRIVAVGGVDLLNAYTAPTMIDLAGRLLLPGFNDAHTHIDGNPRNFVEVSGARSVAELAELVKGMTSVVQPGQWITGYGWSEDRFAEGRKPTRTDLDAVAPDPALLRAKADMPALPTAPRSGSRA